MTIQHYTPDGVQFRQNPKDKRIVERKLPSARWQLVERCADEQDAKALLFRLVNGLTAQERTHGRS